MNRDILITIIVVALIIGAGGVAVTLTNRWPGKAPEKYRAFIEAAETREGIPHNLLARLLWQESRYREDIINGTVQSSAGALGIAQIVPRWHPDVNPLDPWASIDYAAKYLRSLRGQFGTWQLALAAYNWGPGNLTAGLSKYGGNVLLQTSTPKETRDYVSQIWGDYASTPT